MTYDHIILTLFLTDEQPGEDCTLYMAVLVITVNLQCDKVLKHLKYLTYGHVGIPNAVPGNGYQHNQGQALKIHNCTNMEEIQI